MTDIKNWRNTAAGNDIAGPPDFPQEGWSSPQVNDTVREMMAAVRRWYEAEGYQDRNHNGAGTFGTVSKLTDDSIRVSGVDLTAVYNVGRQVRVRTGAGAWVYRFVSTSALNGSDTDITFTTDAANPVPSGADTSEVFIGSRVRSTAFKGEGAGGGLDADTVDGLQANDLTKGGLNNIINGAMQLWQRGTSFTAVGYCADRWRIADLGVGGGATITRLTNIAPTAGLPEAIRNALTWAQTSTPTSNPILEQRIEDARTLAGRQVTISFYAKATSAITVSTLLRQNFGTGGAPSPNVDSAAQNHSITSTWQRFTHTLTLASVVGKTFGTDGNDFLGLRFQLPLSIVTIDITGVQIEPRASASVFEVSSFSSELLRAQRYYWKTFPQATAPAQNAGAPGALMATAGGPSTSRITTHVVLPVAMRASPSLTAYNPLQADSQWSRDDGTAGADIDSAFANISETSFAAIDGDASLNLSGTNHQHYLLHVTAEAEL